MNSLILGGLGFGCMAQQACDDVALLLDRDGTLRKFLQPAEYCISTVLDRTPGLIQEGLSGIPGPRAHQSSFSRTGLLCRSNFYRSVSCLSRATPACFSLEPILLSLE